MNKAEFVVEKKGKPLQKGDRVKVMSSKTEEIISEESKIFFVPGNENQYWILWDVNKETLYQIDDFVKLKKLD